MANKTNDYTLIFKAQFNEQDIDRQIKSIQEKLNKINLNIGTNSLTDASKGLKNVGEQAKNASVDIQDLGLTFQQANMIMQQSIDIITSMVEQVYEMDAAIIEFQKVSDLSGDSLNDYIESLQTMGSAVGRTGKPKRQAPDDGIVNQHQELLEIQYNLRAYSATIAA